VDKQDFRIVSSGGVGQVPLCKHSTSKALFVFPNCIDLNAISPAKIVANISHVETGPLIGTGSCRETFEVDSLDARKWPPLNAPPLSGKGVERGL